LGASVANVDRYLLPLIGVIVAVSMLPLAVEALRARRRTRPTAQRTREHTS
jgi:membrane-associated protein